MSHGEGHSSAGQVGDEDSAALELRFVAAIPAFAELGVFRGWRVNLALFRPAEARRRSTAAAAPPPVAPAEGRHRTRRVVSGSFGHMSVE